MQGGFALYYLRFQLPVSFVGFPAIIVWVLAGKSHRAYWAGIVAQITAVIVLLVLGVIRNISRVRERDKINMVWLH